MAQRFDKVLNEQVEIDPGAARKTDLKKYALESNLKALRGDLRGLNKKVESIPLKKHTHANKGIKSDIKRLKRNVKESIIMVAETIESIEDNLIKKMDDRVIRNIDGGRF
jgi:hypothetical protein